MARLGLVLSVLGVMTGCVLVGCGPKQQPATTTPAPPVTSPPARAVTSCASDEVFATLRWVPASARAVTLIDLRDPGLPEALARLEQGARTPQRQLPIRVAFALGQWSWQVPLLRSTLQRAGFEPAQLVHIALEDGTSSWAWPQSCDLETTESNIEIGWGLSLRATAYGALAAAQRTPEGDFTFPYDFVAFGASAFLLTPGGRAQSVTQRLAEPPRDPSAPTLADAAGALERAPLRLAVRTDALVTPGAQTPTGGPIATHRIDAASWTSPAP